MRLKVTIAAIMAAGTIAAIPTAAPARPPADPIAHVARACSGSFVSARINGVHKCLHAGEFCTHRYDRHAPRRYAYIDYGFRCIKYYSNVQRYRLTYA